ncbi:MAG: alpha/beta hydrolase [Burkholderiaceae bacterium]|nr:MAG: alpha/beta hydrolase [Burkholderiaceae bacterium]MCC7288419.1 alpha/beta hydrolase [Burkholderiaceae bacterium]
MTTATSRSIAANGITLRIVEQGRGPLVLLCHGWPELAHSWRHQIPALAAAGYHAVAPDMRGYGGSSVPHEVGAYAITDLVGDMVALVAALGATRACIVGHDWGANVAWSAALMRPDLFAAVAAMSVPHRPRNPAAPPLALLKAAGLEDFYWFYFNREGVPEAEFERDVAQAMRKVLVGGSGDAPKPGSLSLTVPQGAGFLDRMPDPDSLPAWLSAADIEVFAAAFRKNGLRGPFNWYRNIDRNWALLAPWQGAQVQPPALFVAGTRDGVIASPMGRKALDTLADSVPRLRDKLLIEGAGHWIQQERPAAVNAALLRFLAADYPVR